MAAPVPEHPEQKANYGSSSTRELSDETIGAIFRELDLDGSGYLSEQEMAEVFHQLQLPFARGVSERRETISPLTAVCSSSSSTTTTHSSSIRVGARPTADSVRRPG